MSLQIIHGDITKITCDAIVNAANPTLLGGCKVGRAKITKGYCLPSRYVIHTVGPRWKGGKRSEAQKLASCYSESLKLAKKYGCKSVAFPLISAGIYGYPKEQAIQIASETINKCLQEDEIQVYLVIYA